MSLTHPSIRKDGNAKAMPVKNYVVEDATQTVQDLDANLQQFEAPAERPLMPPAQVFEKAKEVAQKPKSTVSDETRKKLEGIVFLGRLTKTVEIAGQKFEISTLTNRENNEMMKELYNFGDGADLFAIRVLSLANALKSINGVKLDDLDAFSADDDENFISPYKRRQEIIDNLQLALVEKLYEEYNKLVQENEALVNGTEIKK